MSELGKMTCCVALWGVLIGSAWLTGLIASHLSQRGGHELRCYDERIIDVAVGRSIMRSKQFAASDLHD